MGLFSSDEVSKKNDSVFNGNEKDKIPFGAGIAIGIGIGCGIGVATGNLAAGVAIGVGVGLAFGAAFKRQNDKSNKE